MSRYPALFHELQRRHWSEADLRALAGANVLRVLRDAESHARPKPDPLPSAAELAAGRPP